MTSCFCRENQSRPSSDVVISIENGQEMVPMPLDSSDDEDFENVEVVEDK